MTRSHPPTLITLAARALREECAVARGDRLLAAVSGGPDSMALLDVLARLREKQGIELAAHGVDHGLRPEARGELDLAGAYAARLGVPFDVTRLSLRAGGNLQARAREARYTALERAASARGLALIATAHHADDRAETVLIRLMRGAGPRGLAVLGPRDGQRVRPLIRARRADVLAHVARHALPFSQDPSNLDRRFLRARVRAELLPLLTELSPGIVNHLNALADALGAGAELAAWQAAAADENVELGRSHLLLLSRIRGLTRASARVRLPGGKEARVDPATGKVTIAAAEPSDRR